MLASVNHILGLTNIQRRRYLPVNGSVLVRVGQKVSASDVIAEAQIATRHMLLDIRRSMGGATTAEADRSIVRAEGDKLQQGDVIAEGKGFFARVVRAPAASKIAMVAGGRVLLEVESQPIQVQAGLPGVVTELIPERGAVIEANGALIQGAWGNGRIGEGLMIPILHSPDEELTSEMLEVSLRGSVVVAGHCRQVNALRAAADLALNGLVLASMTSDLLMIAARMEYPIMVLEGFGHIPMNAAAYQLITTSEKRDAAINSVFNPSSGSRPEMILPLPAFGTAAVSTTTFAPNQTVRIQGDPYQSKIGVLVQIRPGLTVLPNGLRAQAADVRLEKDIQVTIPLANLEVIE
jgi:hypothetical protein